MKKQVKKKDERPAVHFVPQEITHPYNPVTVNLIGAGGTGGQVLTALARMNHALIALGHAGLFVRVFDDDRVDPANLGRQLFTTAELGQYKAVALVNRVNRFFGTNWKAETMRFDTKAGNLSAEISASVNISCVDTAAARFQIAKILTDLTHQYHGRNRSLYWMDFGNGRFTGQVVLSTLDTIKQPVTDTYRTVNSLPLVTEEYKELLMVTEGSDDTPSCSLAEALTKQDLFINSALANCGSSLLWQMFREGRTSCRGIFLNLATFSAQAIPV